MIQQMYSKILPIYIVDEKNDDISLILITTAIKSCTNLVITRKKVFNSFTKLNILQRYNSTYLILRKGEIFNSLSTRNTFCDVDI